MAVLKANRAIESDRLCEISKTQFPRMRSVMAGLACWLSILLIQPLLHVSQTTLAVKSRPFMLHSLTTFPESSLLRNLNFLELNSSRIHSLQMCSPEILAVAGQKAHSSDMDMVRFSTDGSWLVNYIIAAFLIAEISAFTNFRPAFGRLLPAEWPPSPLCTNPRSGIRVFGG